MPNTSTLLLGSHDSKIDIRELQHLLELDLREQFQTGYVSSEDYDHYFGIFLFLEEVGVLAPTSSRHYYSINYQKAQALVDILVHARDAINALLPVETQD